MADLLDAAAVIASTDLVGRTGATGLEVGYLHDDVPSERAGWWAAAHYRGARITVDDQAGPVEALTALARRILTGARCRCGRLVALSDQGGARWARGCEGPSKGSHQGNRAKRKKPRRRRG